MKRRVSDDEPAQKRSKSWVEKEVEKEEKEDFERQYIFGRKIVDPTLKHYGCENHLFGTPMLSVKSPVDRKMRVQIQVRDGLSKRGKGSIRLSAPDKGVIRGDHERDARTFVFPFIYMEQILILPPPRKTKTEAYRVVIVPSGCADASAIGRALPDIVDFGLPDRKAREDLTGTYRDRASPNDTYLDLFEQVYNDIPKKRKKWVVRYDKNHDLSAVLTMKKPPMGFISRGEGQLFLLSTGLFFSCGRDSLQSCYFSHASIKSIFLVVDKDMTSSQSSKDANGVNLGLQFNVYYANRDKPALSLAFSGLKPTQTNLDQYQRYFEKHDIQHARYQQTWYNYAKKEPMGVLEGLEGF